MLPIDRILEAFPEAGAFRAARSGSRVVFTNDDPTLTVLWDVTDADLAALAASRSAGSRAAFGSKDGGWSLLLNHVDEELRTFTGERGRLRVDGLGRLRIDEE